MVGGENGVWCVDINDGDASLWVISWVGADLQDCNAIGHVGERSYSVYERWVYIESQSIVVVFMCEGTDGAYVRGEGFLSNFCFLQGIYHYASFE